VATDVFSALASPVRRSLLTMLAERPQTVNELASRFDMRRPSVSEHLRVLRETGLVREQRAGRTRVYDVDAQPLHDVVEWLESFEDFWQSRVHALRGMLDDDRPG
jgi:DNA-binding transcriptional ArsR family regulator